MVEPAATARLQIDLSALVKNWKTLNKLSGCAGAAVKANAYGLGAPEITKSLYEAGCRDFFVANWNEANQLKHIIPQYMISVLNGIDKDNIEFARAHHFKPVLNTPSQIMMWREIGGGLCDVMLDSGINRLGVGKDQFDSSLFDGLDIDIAMSHLASADEDIAQNEAQRKLYNEMHKAINCKRYSLANSAAIMLGADYHYDVTRPGIALYGGVTHDKLEPLILPVIKIKCKILQTRIIRKGQGVGYNATFICPEDMMVATASLGYADGYKRALSGTELIHNGYAIFHNRKLPIIGRISMDLVTIDIRESSDISEDDWVNIEFNICRLSKLTAISQYELLTNLGNRYDRRYVE